MRIPQEDYDADQKVYSDDLWLTKGPHYFFVI